jgi:23S rRNA (cytidine1920-2'-O)/16S rRNA (cytidine1409-2'-O)-methyltransferase
MRLDVYLHKNNYAASRARAAFLIESGAVSVNNKICLKAAQNISPDCVVAIKSEVLPYVSRGGLKLAGALADFDICDIVHGAIALDIGTSTGGFADCLLQHGAARIYAVDSGRGQLHSDLRGNEKIISLEERNARELTHKDVPELCDIATIDVSFTSQTLLYSAIVPLLSPGAVVVSLVKPQFEAGRAGLTKSGRVRTPAILRRVFDDVTVAAKLHGFHVEQIVPSRQLGGEGTEEYFFLMRKI